MQELPEISIIIPAYQEELRIKLTIEQLVSYLEKNHPVTEIVLVCDGCRDRTAQTARSVIIPSDIILKIIELPNNLGKGNAVREGILAAQGNYLFFTDADLSFAPDIIDSFLEKLRQGADIVIAQREKSATYANLLRRLLAVSSRALIGNILLPGISDTQAGFKAFQSKVGKQLFSKLQTKAYLFDLEILLQAKKARFKIEKVYVNWTDRPGSRVNVLTDTPKAVIDLILICIRNFFAN